MAYEAALTGAKIDKRADSAALQLADHLSVELILEAVPYLAMPLTVFRVVEGEELGLIRLGVDVVESAEPAANNTICGALPVPGAHVRVLICVAHGAGYRPHRPSLDRGDRVP
jgi:predicted RecB family endonuclease